MAGGAFGTLLTDRRHWCQLAASARGCNYGDRSSFLLAGALSYRWRCSEYEGTKSDRVVFPFHPILADPRWPFGPCSSQLRAAEPCPNDAEIRRNIVVDRVDDGGKWAGPMVLLIICALMFGAYVFGQAR